MAEERPTLAVAYYDGRHPRPQPVVLQLDGEALHIRGEALELRVPRRAVVWPERQRHGLRQAQLPDDGVLQAEDAAAWDAWAAASGLRSSAADRLSRSWRGVAVGLSLLLLMAWLGVRWGVPAGAHALALALPAEIEAQLGDAVLEHLDSDTLRPSELPPDQQRALRMGVEHAVARWAQRDPQAVPPRWRFEFRSWPEKHGGPAAGVANAVALPGGTVIVTDALARGTADRPELLAAAIGHELGHVQHRHGVRLVVQSGLLAAASSLLFGDFSSVLAAAPALLGQATYARGFELEADRSAAGLMRANDRPLDDYAELFRRLRAGRTDDEDGWPTGLASHPPDAQRLQALGIGP